MPEFIVRADGAEKRDCERNAAKRWLAAHGERMKDTRPSILVTISSPASRSVRPFWRAAAIPAGAGTCFLFTAKPDSHVALCDFMNGAERNEASLTRKEGVKKLTFRYRWFTGAPLAARAGTR